MNETLLHVAVLQEQAKVRTQRRVEGWVLYGVTPLLIAGLAFLFLIMVYDDDPRTSWDFSLPIVGVAAWLLWAYFLYFGRRAQALRERRFGASLRDQVARHLAQLDYQATRVDRLGNVLRDSLPPFVCGIAILLAGWRINNEPFRTQWALDRRRDPLFVCLLGRNRLVTAAPGETRVVAAQAPAGGITEGARWPVNGPRACDHRRQL